jgi:hypothetical protein
MYDFDNGAVKLDCKGGVYEISVNGEKISRGDKTLNQSRNSILAIQEFTNEISLYLKEKAKAYLREQGYNPIEGCKNNIACAECLKKGLNKGDSNCILGEKFEKE